MVACFLFNIHVNSKLFFSTDGPNNQRPGSYSGSESEATIMDHLLSDIRSGFPQRKYSDHSMPRVCTRLKLF